ncbi:Methyltransferase type 12 [Alkaliphilus metalliredigens QYMF]|uniref:Methyltransferase type 12 n=1 Tax=Alkaliphilus metalliredigens (strain QYMF) TaxID=293826 RepID=A6TTU6_ALKMQ|nr:class I SAM-dependent methyltransferase [Alkaliphilus metalliredigens]ABR49614.1 Methyltransferase type 12 [Alkaliphilus metalliredigens QYMF]
MNNQKIWDFWAQHYEGLWVQKNSLAPTREKILLYLEGLLEKGKTYRIVDVGCGTGELLREMAKTFSRDDYDLQLSGIDFSQNMIKRAKEMGGSIEYEQLNVKELTSLEGQFDIIICSHSFPYYEDQRAVLELFKENLKTNGHLLLAQASQNNLYDQVVMSFVKLTVGRAHYPSVEAIVNMAQGLFQVLDMMKIKKGFFMPSIIFFVLKVESEERQDKGENHENFID